MSGTITRKQQQVPISTPIQQVAGQTAGSSSIADGTELPLVILLDENAPDRKVSPAGDDTLLAGFGVDSTDANATQATGGAGQRGWLSTLVALFRSGNAKVTLNGASAVTIANGSDSAEGSTTDTAYTGSGAASVVALLKGLYGVLSANVPIRALTAATDTVSVAGTVTTATTGTVSVSNLPADYSRDGVDSTDANATQATAGVGARGWLSTLTSLFRSGNARVSATLRDVGGTAIAGTTLGGYGALRVAVTNSDGTLASAVRKITPTQTAIPAVTSTAVAFGQTVSGYFCQNNTTATLYLCEDASATPGSLALVAGASIQRDLSCAQINFYAPVATQVNGTTAGAIVLNGLY